MGIPQKHYAFLKKAGTKEYKASIYVVVKKDKTNPQ